MLLEKIRNHKELSKYLCTDCTENGIAFVINPIINKEDIVIIKIDTFYNECVPNPDCSPDCLVILRCADNTYSYFIVELRDISGPKGFKISDIEEKFNTCLGDFMLRRFGDIFYCDDVQIKHIKLYFISDPYQLKKYPDRQLFDRTTRLDTLMSIRIPRYFDRHLYIENKLPNPTVNPC